MKVKFDIECTPQEARAFFGLPNVEPMQDAVMKELEKRMLENIRQLEPETMLKTWLPATIQGWGEVQKLFWEQMGMGGSAPKSASADSKKINKARF
jgi:hypothetical protein